MTIFRLGLEWDCASLADIAKSAFKKRKLTNKRGEQLDESLIFGSSDSGKTAFIAEGFDKKNKFGIIVTLPTDKKEIHIIGGRYNDDATLKAKYNEKFTDLSEASKYFEKALEEYDKEIKN